MEKEKTSKVSANGGQTVAVIGCGPSGMFFLHALRHRREEMEAAGDVDGLSKFPKVTCFERASEPGGVWRAGRQDVVGDDNVYDEEGYEVKEVNGAKEGEGDEHDEKSVSEISSSSDSESSSESSETSLAAIDVGEGDTNMYEALWMNSAKELIEFPDYTYEEHFNGAPLPVYLPRTLMLDYIFGRVKKGNPNFFDPVRFNTNVDFVMYDDDKKKFEITTTNKITMDKTTSYFDKCLWAAGENGRPAVPSALASMLKRGNFAGKTVHSSKAGNELDQTRGKKILLIGDSLSAEDIALQCIKLGVEKVYVYSRSGEGDIHHNGSFPLNKVEILEDYMPSSVTNDRKGIKFIEAKFNHEEWRHFPIAGGNSMILEDISYVIYCTGYMMNMDFLDTPLQEMDEDWEDYYFEDMPKDWTMKPNVILEDMGEITPHEEIESFEINVSPLLFRGITTYNPNFMMLFDKEDLPLTEIDIGAWYLMRYVVGDVKFPSPKERRECDKRRILKSMQDPYARYQIDSNWFMKWYKLGADHWAWKPSDPRHKAMKESFCRLKIQLNASDMIDAGYPADIGNIDQLNEKGEMLVKMLMDDWMAHDSLDPNSEDSAWKTYRDTDASKFVSIYSGAVAAPLRRRWMDYIDVTAEDTHMICAPQKGENDATSSLACEEKKDDCVVHVS